MSSVWKQMLILTNTMNETGGFHVSLAPLISLISTSVITLLGLPLNIFLLIVFVKSATLHNLENSFVANLIIADLFLGISALGNAVFQNIPFADKQIKRMLCQGIHSVNMYINAVQLYAFCLLTFDRFLKVVYPFTHNRLSTKRNIILVIVMTYTFALLIGISSGLNFEWDEEHYCLMFYLTSADIMLVSGLFLFCIILAIFGLNMKILMVARRQRMVIMAQARHGASEETTTTNARNIGKILGIVTLFTFVTYIPSWVYIALLILNIPIENSLSDGLAFVSMVLWVLNPLVDTLTFLLCRKDIKSCVQKLLRPESN